MRMAEKMKINLIKRNPTAIGVVFPFNEVNAGVFQNAGLWAAKKNFGVETTIYTPNQFRGLYFAVDKISEILPLPYQSYQEVAEYEPNSISRNEIATYFSKGTINYLHHRSLELLPASIFHSIPARVRADYKSRRFLVKSGILESSRKSFYSVNSQDNSLFLGDALYYDLAKFEQRRKNLKEYFQYSFENLYNMILAGNINHGMDITQLDQSSIKSELDFLQKFGSKSPKIFLRTRNINSSVRFQNARAPELRELVRELLKNGFIVINSGVPAVSLDIDHDNYLEYSHNLSIATEMYLANHCNYVMQTAWAGLFTAFASFKKPLITFNEEWSLANIEKSVSLLEARREIGMKDIQLGVSFAADKDSITNSVRKIVSNW